MGAVSPPQNHRDRASAARALSMCPATIPPQCTASRWRLTPATRPELHGDHSPCLLRSRHDGRRGNCKHNNNNNCCGWGYNSWHTRWNHSSVNYTTNVSVSNSNTVVNRSNANYNNVNRNNVNRNNINANNVNRNDLNRATLRSSIKAAQPGVGDRNQGVGDLEAGVEAIAIGGCWANGRNQGSRRSQSRCWQSEPGVGDRNQGARQPEPKAPAIQRPEQRGYGQSAEPWSQ